MKPSKIFVLTFITLFGLLCYPKIKAFFAIPADQRRQQIQDDQIAAHGVASTPPHEEPAAFAPEPCDRVHCVVGQPVVTHITDGSFKIACSNDQAMEYVHMIDIGRINEDHPREMATGLAALRLRTGFQRRSDAIRLCESFKDGQHVKILSTARYDLVTPINGGKTLWVESGDLETVP